MLIYKEKINIIIKQININIFIFCFLYFLLFNIINKDKIQSYRYINKLYFIHLFIFSSFSKKLCFFINAKHLDLITKQKIENINFVKNHILMYFYKYKEIREFI